MEKKSNTIFWVIVGILFVIFLSQFIFTQKSSNTIQFTGDGASVEFAQCLTSNGAVFYGTEWCPYCNNQKQMFGNSMQYVNYVDCDKERETCLREGIQGYPTWKVNGRDLVGTQSLEALASATSCQL